jgi:hypothetical protein
MRTIILLFLFSGVASAQLLQPGTTRALEVDKFVGVDSYQHLYYIHDGVLHKDGELGKFVFRDFQLGPIASVDIINPLNVVVFYADVNTVVFLDNRLSEKERINFNNLPSFLNISAATNAGNNRLWIFNTDSQQLQLYDYRSRRATIFSQPYEGKLVAQASDFNSCLLLTENYLWEVNIYGSLLSEIKLEGFDSVVRNGKKIIGLKENQLYYIKEETIIPLEINLNENHIKDLQLTQEFLYIYDGKILSTYKLTQPK